MSYTRAQSFVANYICKYGTQSSDNGVLLLTALRDYLLCHDHE